VTKDDRGNNPWANRWTAAAEIMLIFLLFFLYAGWPPPDVNEAHYLAKAKHYWQPEWCATDHFLQSADAHLVFYWTLGWLTRLAPLPVAAWLGRFLTWILLAWSWRRLSWAVIPRPFASLLTACGFLLFSGRFHMAGEWVVGGFEAKGIAYSLVFFALGAILRQRWNLGWILLGAATAFHVLVGGWSLVAAGCAWLACQHLRPPLTRMLPAIGAALVLALPGLVPALWLNHDVSAEVVREANSIYVYGRLAHHLVFHRFPHWHMARFAILLVVWLVACRATICPISAGKLGQRPLRGFVCGAVLIAVVGIAIDQSLLAVLLVPSQRCDAAGGCVLGAGRVADRPPGSPSELGTGRPGRRRADRGRKPGLDERPTSRRPAAGVGRADAAGLAGRPGPHAPHVRRLATDLSMDRGAHAAGRLFHHAQDAADVQVVRGAQRGVLLERRPARRGRTGPVVATAEGPVSAPRRVRGTGRTW